MRKLAIRSLRRGVGSMDYIESLLIMEDDLDEDESLDDFGNSIKITISVIFNKAMGCK